MSLVAAVAVGVAAFVLARATLMPDVGLWDTAEAQTVPPLLGTMHPTGYPAYVVLGWLASVLLQPFGSPAFAMNLLSALLLGVAAGATVELVRLLTGRLAIGVATGLGAAATPVVWGLGVRADVHALHLALVALLLLALVGWQRALEGRPGTADRWLLAAAVLFGVALAGHRLIVLFAPGITAFVLLVDPSILRRPRLMLAAGGLVVGVAALLYLQLLLRAGPFPAPLVYGHPDTLTGFWYVVLGTQFGGAIASPLGDLAGKLDGLVTITDEQLGPLGSLAGLAAIVTAVRRPHYAVLTVPAVALTWLFAVSYENASIERYHAVPALIAWTWLGIGAAAIVDLVVGRSSDGDPDPSVAADRSGARRAPVRPGAAVAIVAAVLLLVPTAIALPRRWAAVDASGDTVGRTWLEAALTALPEDAVVVSWWSYSTPLWYAQHIEGRRSDIWVVDDRTRLDEGLGGVSDVIDANLGRRPVYLIRVDTHELAGLVRRYHMTPVSLPVGQSLLRVDDMRDRR